MSQENEPGCAVACQAVPLVQAKSRPRVEKTREALRRKIRNGERAAYVTKTTSHRPEATSTALGLPLECRDRGW